MFTPDCWNEKHVQPSGLASSYWLIRAHCPWWQKVASCFVYAFRSIGSSGETDMSHCIGKNMHSSLSLTWSHAGGCPCCKQVCGHSVQEGKGNRLQKWSWHLLRGSLGICVWKAFLGPTRLNLCICLGKQGWSPRQGSKLLLRFSLVKWQAESRFNVSDIATAISPVHLSICMAKKMAQALSLLSAEYIHFKNNLASWPGVGFVEYRQKHVLLQNVIWTWGCEWHWSATCPMTLNPSSQCWSNVIHQL